MKEIYFVATLPDFNKAVEIEYEACQPPLIFTDDLLPEAIKYKDRLNKKYGTDIFNVYKATVDNIEEVA